MRGIAGRARHTGEVFSCPRCQTSVDERFYGPCATCRADLRASLGGAAREVESAAFEPSLHVTPNAVALKDD
jgi:hypothetical protein